MAQITQAQMAKKLAARMTDAEHQDVQTDFFGLFYGDKGTRKSTTAQGVAQKLRDDGKILFAAAGTGFASLNRFPALKKHTNHLYLPDPVELFQLSKVLRTRAAGFEDYSVVVLDDFDSWWQDTLHNFAHEQAGTDPDVDELPVIDWTWYGPPQQAMMNVVKNFFKTPDLHVIITSAEQGRARKDEKGGQDRFTPLLGTKLSAGIGHMAHVVGRFESRKVQQKYLTEVQIQPTRYVDAKSRLDNTDKIKLDAVELVKTIEEWVYGGGVEQAELSPEADVELQEVEDDGDDEDFEVADGEE